MSRLNPVAELAALKRRFFDEVSGKALQDFVGGEVAANIFAAKSAADEAAAEAAVAQGTADRALADAAAADLAARQAQSSANAAQAKANVADSRAGSAQSAAGASVQVSDSGRALDWTGASSVKVPVPAADSDAATKKLVDDSVSGLASEGYVDGKFTGMASGTYVFLSNTAGNKITMVIANGLVSSVVEDLI